MSSTLRALFLARPAREKLLLLLLLLVAALIWCFSLVGRAQAFAAQVRSTSSQLRNQQMWISRQASVEKQAEAEGAQLDAAKTLDALALTAAVQSMANNAGLGPNFGVQAGPSQQPYGKFAFHTVLLSAQRVNWDALTKFCLDIQKHAPYIGVDSFSILADRANPALLNISMNIASVEIARAP